MPFLLILLLLLTTPAVADSLVSGLGTVATSPMTPGSCMYIDQGAATDAKVCATSPLASSMAAYFGALAVSNNLSDVGNVTASRNNLAAAPTASPTFTGTVTVPALNQNATGAIAATADFVKAQEFAVDVAWLNQAPNLTCVHIAHQAERVTGINGRVTVAASGGATVTIVKVASGSGVPAGGVFPGAVALTTAPTPNLLATASVNVNQTLTLVASQASLSLAVGDALCVQDNSPSGGSFITSDGVITVSYVKQ